MKNPIWRALTLSVLFLAASSAANAQATRTWVSGVGDDANPCSRTAPCKTFAGAISKTAAGGTISVLDPAGFGAVTITKSITIEGVGSNAGVLVSGTNGIVVNAAATDTIILRNLNIEGLSTGLNGIRFLAGLALYVEECAINRFTQKGIDFEPSTNAALFVKNTRVRNNSFGAGGGIFVKPSGAGSATATIDNVHLERNLFGVRAEGSSKVSIIDSVISGNSNEGVLALTAGTAPVINVVGSLVTLNGNGIKADGVSAIVRMAGTSVLNNNTTGVSGLNGGVVNSFGDNNIRGNSPDNAPTLLPTPKQ